MCIDHRKEKKTKHGIETVGQMIYRRRRRRRSYTRILYCTDVGARATRRLDLIITLWINDRRGGVFFSSPETRDFKRFVFLF